MKNISLQNIKIGLAVIVLTGLVIAMSIFLPPAVDWHGAFRPAALEILHGRSPYNADGFFNSPWTAILLIPFAILPENVGRAILVLVTLGTYTYVAYKLGAKPIAILFLLVSPPVFHLILNGNIDWMATLGFIMPPQIGLFFISMKPQMGLAIAPFWLIQAWRQGGLAQTIKTFGPFLAALAISFILFGLWPLGVFKTGNLSGSASLWPMSIPIGLALFITAVRKQRIEYAMAASPCLSPYLLLHSWVGALLAVISSVPETIATVIGLWILFFIKMYS